VPLEACARKNVKFPVLVAGPRLPASFTIISKLMTEHLSCSGTQFCGEYFCGQIHTLYCLPNSGMMCSTLSVDKCNDSATFCLGNLKGKKAFGRPRSRWQITLQEIS
jgi:hypothetical protein